MVGFINVIPSHDVNVWIMIKLHIYRSMNRANRVPD
jgi:hypothetical protein